MEREYHVVVSLSTVEQTLNQAKAIISLAKEHSEQAETLAACATILLAAALEQGTRSILTLAAERNAIEEGIDISETTYANLYKESLWWRVQSLPNVLTGGRFQLMKHNRIVKQLRELIYIRNKLAHIDEPAIHLISPNQQIKIENNHLIVEIPVPENPWSSITLRMAENFLEAVDTYIREILFPESEQISDSSIIVPIM